MRVRQSTLGDFDKCARAMQYSIESPVYHGGVARAIGTAYHAGLEFAYNNLRANDVWPDVRMAIIEAIERFDRTAALEPSHESEKTKRKGTFKWDDAFPDAATAHATIAHMLESYWGDPDCRWPWPVLGTELGFSLPFWGDHTRNGSIDLVLEDPNGWIVGVDHKTAGKGWNFNKHHARKQNQAPWYVAALRELFPDAPGYRFFFDIMTYKGKFDRREAVVSPEHIAAVDTKAVQVVTLYEGMRAGGFDLPANPASNLCSPKYCDHWDICPHGAVLDVQ
jgi:hypothetical protein